MPVSAPPDILLIENTPSLRTIYEAHLRSEGYHPIATATASEGLVRFRQHGMRIVLMDLAPSDYDGLDLLAEILAQRPETAVIALSTDPSTEIALHARRAGAIEILAKPVEEARFRSALEKARRHIAGTMPIDGPRQSWIPHGLVGQSAPMREVCAHIRAAASSDAPVFITGESGTGKGLCARMIHDHSNRATGPFIALDCAALPHDHPEAELFGHVRGAFAGALSGKTGAIPAADGGTLFLDNLSEMPLSLQAKLQRVIEGSVVHVLGDPAPREVNLRFICATTTLPESAQRAAHLREDLYYRLHVLPVRMPPLRDRREDIAPLIEHFLKLYATERTHSFSKIEPAALTACETYDWPGNIRQLMNCIRSAVVLHEGPVLRLDMLPVVQGDSAEARDAPTMPTLTSLAGRSLAEIERVVIEAALARHDGSVPRAAAELGVAPSTLYRKLDSWRA